MQTDLDSYLITTTPSGMGQDDGRTDSCMFKKGLKLIPKEVRTKVA